MVKCPNCGSEVKEGTKFCPKCGANINQPTINQNNSNINNQNNKKSSSLKKIGIIIGALIVVGLLAVVAIGMMTPDTTISVNDLKITDEGYGVYKINGNLLPDKDYDYLEMVVVFYDDSGAVIDKSPLAWNMNGISKDQTIKITGSAFLTSSQNPSKAEVYFFDSPFSGADLSDSIYNSTIDFSSGSSVTATTSDSSLSSSSMSILSGTISTGSSLSDKTQCSVYVGSEYAGENVKISVLYSRDGSNLNQGKIVPKTVTSDGYVSVPSADAFKKYPDNAIITIYDSNGNTLDTETVNLSPSSGSQYF